MSWNFTFLLVTSGVLIGLMYALIALGFVLVYKATDAINFAQGEFVMAPAIVAAVVAALRRASGSACWPRSRQWSASASRSNAPCCARCWAGR